MSAFPVAFRDHVMPKLKAAARVQGVLLALNDRPWSDAYDAVMDIARQRGAMHLTDDILMDLETWIACQILAACAEVEPAVQEHRETADRVAADIERWEAAWRMTMA